MTSWFVICEWLPRDRRRCIEFPTKEAAEAWISERFQETGPGTFFKLIDIYRIKTTETP
jgi:hypothetical protein